jgi:DinB superfamily
MKTPKKVSQEVRELLGLVQGRDPMDVLIGTGARLSSMLRATAEEYLIKRPQPDKWSIAETIAHLTDVELVFGYRLRIVLEHPGAALQAFDQDKWAVTGQYHLMPPLQSLGRLLTQREANVSLLCSLSVDQWKQFGIHTERGQQTIADIVIVWANHDLKHLHAIENLLQSVNLHN